MLNCSDPNSNEARELAAELELKYSVSCIRVNCLAMSEHEIENIISDLLSEFPTEDFAVCFPQWVDSLPMDNAIKTELFAEIKRAAIGIKKLKDAQLMQDSLESLELCSEVRVSDVYMGKGSFTIRCELPRTLYYRTLSEECGLEISDDGDLISILCELAKN